jgi:hypothetical protein
LLAVYLSLSPLSKTPSKEIDTKNKIEMVLKKAQIEQTLRNEKKESSTKPLIRNRPKNTKQNNHEKKP